LLCSNFKYEIGSCWIDWDDLKTPEAVYSNDHSFLRDKPKNLEEDLKYSLQMLAYIGFWLMVK